MTKATNRRRETFVDARGMLLAPLESKGQRLPKVDPKFLGSDPKPLSWADVKDSMVKPYDSKTFGEVALKIGKSNLLKRGYFDRPLQATLDDSIATMDDEEETTTLYSQETGIALYSEVKSGSNRQYDTWDIDDILGQALVTWYEKEDKIRETVGDKPLKAYIAYFMGIVRNQHSKQYKAINRLYLRGFDTNHQGLEDCIIDRLSLSLEADLQQAELLDYIQAGYTLAESAEKAGISRTTAKKRLQEILEELPVEGMINSQNAYVSRHNNITIVCNREHAWKHTKEVFNR